MSGKMQIWISYPETFCSGHGPASWAGVGGAWDALKRIGFCARYWRTFEYREEATGQSALGVALKSTRIKRY